MDVPHLSFETLWDVEFDVGCVDTRKFDVDCTDKMREIPVLQIQQYHKLRFKYQNTPTKTLQNPPTNCIILMHQSGFWVLLFDCLDRIVKTKNISFYKSSTINNFQWFNKFSSDWISTKKTEHQINVTTDVNLKILIDTFYYSPA